MTKIKIHHSESDNVDNTNKYCQVQTDYCGNIILKFNDEYYIIILDSTLKNGAIINKIKCPDRLRKNLQSNLSIINEYKSGKIHSTPKSLRGLTRQTLSDMNDEERDDYMTKNNFYVDHQNFTEGQYYWTSYENNDDLLECEEDDGFYLNGIISSDESDMGINGIVKSDILLYTPGTFDTILMIGNLESKYVASTLERIDEYCTNRLIIYSEGYIKINFIDKNIISKICIDSTNNELMLHLL